MDARDGQGRLDRALQSPRAGGLADRHRVEPARRRSRHRLPRGDGGHRRRRGQVQAQDRRRVPAPGGDRGRRGEIDRAEARGRREARGMSGWKARTVVQAIEDAAVSTTTGYRFIDESSEATAEPFFTHGGIERASARFGGALQALGANPGDRVALILPDNADFVFAFLGAIRAGVIPVPIYPPTGLGKLAGYLEN